MLVIAIRKVIFTFSLHRNEGEAPRSSRGEGPGIPAKGDKTRDHSNNANHTEKPKFEEHRHPKAA